MVGNGEPFGSKPSLDDQILMQSEELGRYRIAKELGRGAMGRVFLAHDPQIDRPVAIKTIQIFASLPHKERDKARDRFLREARAAGKLLHPGIVTVFDVGEAGGVPYLAMEYVQGTTLDAFCKRDNLLPVKTVVEIVANAAEALDFAHSTGIVHRDIKPANLMRVAEKQVKIMDFGLARGAEAQVTPDGALLGTPSYMSPEQIRGENPDGRSDLFSLAAVLYELLSGEKSFGGKTVSSIIFRVVNEEPRDASEIHARVPKNLSVFLKHALAKRPEERFPTGNAFAEALRAAGATRPASDRDLTDSVQAQVTGAEPQPEEGLPPAPPRRPSRSSSRPLVVTVVLLAALAGGSAYFYGEEILAFIRPAPQEIWLETRVRTDPPGLPVALDGAPIENQTVRFRSEEPFGVLQASQACRTVTHQLQAADAAGEVVLVPDPIEVELTVDPGIAGARIHVNGADADAAPVRMVLDLCRQNTIELAAKGYRSARVVLPAGATPLEARTALAALRMQPIPKGWLVLGETPETVRFYVDGQQVDGSAGRIELYEGTHKLRVVNEQLWIDITQTVRVKGGETVESAIEFPGVAMMVVQAFPANCKVFLRRKGEQWRYVDETPMRRRIAAGRYEVKVRLKPTGDERVREVQLHPGQNPPIRVSFGRNA